MEKDNLSFKNKDLSSVERLMGAVLDCWEQQGSGAVSARLLSQAADAPVSSIYHYFGSLERLFLATHEHGLALARIWCAEQRAAFGASDIRTPADFPALLAALIDDWCTTCRRLAFAWRECELMAMRDDLYLPVLRAWEEMWHQFWDETCARFGRVEQWLLTYYLFSNESLMHLMRWRRIPDRACLDEMCVGWNSWLGGNLVPDGGWRAFARVQAEREMPEIVIQGGTTEHIARAAAQILAEQGMAGLTHRAVAARAGLTLGVISYNFRSSAELVRAAFEIIYRQAVTAGGGSVADISHLSEAELTARYIAHGTAPLMPALDELLLAVARNADLKSFAPQLRYGRGRSSRALLSAMVGPDVPCSALDGALLSGVLSGLRKAHIGCDAQEAGALSVECIEAVRALIVSPR